MARRGIILFDPDEAPIQSLEQMVRPARMGLYQVQMIEMDEYELYYMDGEQSMLEEFSGFDVLERRVTFLLTQALKDEPDLKRKPDLDFTVGDLCRRVFAIMSNYKIANVDLSDRTTVPVIPEQDVPDNIRPEHLKRANNSREVIR